MLKNICNIVFISSLFVLMLTACSPKYDWREVHGVAAPFSILLPAKPSELSRPISLDGQQVTMAMTAAEIDGVTFAVGTMTMADEERALRALTSIKTALIKNMAGEVKREKASDDKVAHMTSIDIEAVGLQPTNNKKTVIQLVARLVAKNNQVYQVIIIGPENAASRDAIDTFFTSFKLN